MKSCSQKLALLTSALIALVLICQGPVSAGAYPGTGAPMAAFKKLNAEGDSSNPFAYPFLMEIAKSLARNGLPPGFFLQGEGKTSASIDLRAILLFEAGILKAPVRLLVPSKKSDEKVPSLSLPPVPEGGPQFPGDEKVGIVPVPAQPEPLQAEPDRPKLSLDFDRFQLELTKPQNKNELVEPGKEIAMTVTAAKPPVHSDSNTFRLWTMRTEGPPLSQIAIKNQPKIDSYQGSFIFASPGTISSIEGRFFSLKRGELLASSRGKALVFNALQSQITVSPGCSITLDTDGKGLVQVNVLEANDSPVAVKFKNKNGLEELRLSAGEQILLSDQPLTGAERTRLDTLLSGSSNHGETWAKGKFSPSSLAEKNALFKGDALYSSQEFRTAIKSLRARLK